MFYETRDPKTGHWERAEFEADMCKEEIIEVNTKIVTRQKELESESKSRSVRYFGLLHGDSELQRLSEERDRLRHLSGHSDGRDYALFGTLHAGVRTTFTFSMPGKLDMPDDMAPENLEQPEPDDDPDYDPGEWLISLKDCDQHSHSYQTLEELRDWIAKWQKQFDPQAKMKRLVGTENSLNDEELETLERMLRTIGAIAEGLDSLKYSDQMTDRDVRILYFFDN